MMSKEGEADKDRWTILRWAPTGNCAASHLCEEFDRPILLLVQLQHSAQREELIFHDRIKPVHNRDVSPVDLEDNNLPDPDVLLLIVGQKEQVTPLQRKWFKPLSLTVT